ncbi:recombinase family protein [Candidatus Saccharibacteria bacterium]|nr:recombinase family protein [Candidatus Saccharibacteria bacterium]
MRVQEILPNPQEARRAVCDARRGTKSDGKRTSKLLNVAAYARVSSKKDEQYGSLLAQKHYYKEYIKKNSNWNYVGIYADEASGLRIDKRPEFLAMLDDCRKGRIDLILCKSPSRFSRNTVDGLSILRELRSLNVEVWFECYPVSIFDPKAEMYYSIFFSLFQDESRQRSESIKWGMARAAESGKSGRYSRPCYGYRRDKETRKLVIYEPEARVVRRIFELNKEGKGSTRIAKILEAERIVSPKEGRKWHPSTIVNILNNEKYHGDVIIGKNYTKDYINKRVVKNRGERKMYRIEGNHERII